jgi:glyoxylase I family protein
MTRAAQMVSPHKEVGMPAISGIAHVELSVRDLDRSVAWYCKLLGARDVFRATNDIYGITACAILEPQSKLVLAFTQHREEDSSEFDPRRVGLDHVSFAVRDRAELDAWVARLDELGIAHSDVQNEGYAHQVTFRDPDGIALEFSARIPPVGD